MKPRELSEATERDMDFQFMDQRCQSQEAITESITHKNGVEVSPKRKDPAEVNTLNKKAAMPTADAHGAHPLLFLLLATPLKMLDPYHQLSSNAIKSALHSIRSSELSRTKFKRNIDKRESNTDILTRETHLSRMRITVSNSRAKIHATPSLAAHGAQPPRHTKESSQILALQFILPRPSQLRSLLVTPSVKLRLKKKNNNQTHLNS